MEKILLISVLIPFLAVVFLMPFWVRKMREIGLVWKDMNKLDDRRVAGSGGVIVVLGFLLGALSYVAIKIFYFHSSIHLIEIFALLTSILMIGFVGFIDDILGWKRGGLSKRSRLILVSFASIPLMVINAGVSAIYIPFFGVTGLGILYALVLIPLGIVGASTTFNFLAGYNGLEGGQGILILSAVSVMAWLTGNSWLGLIGFCMVFSLLGFMIFNRFPAKVFPGDVMTYSVGSLIAIMAILGNFERFAIFIFLPYIVETGLKLRGGLKKQSFGEPQKDGSIKNQYDKIYGLEHLAIKIVEKVKGRARESDVVFLINFVQLVLIVLGFIIF